MDKSNNPFFTTAVSTIAADLLEFILVNVLFI